MCFHQTLIICVHFESVYTWIYLNEVVIIIEFEIQSGTVYHLLKKKFNLWQFLYYGNEIWLWQWSSWLISPLNVSGKLHWDFSHMDKCEVTCCCCCWTGSFGQCRWHGERLWTLSGAPEEGQWPGICSM